MFRTDTPEQRLDASLPALFALAAQPLTRTLLHGWLRADPGLALDDAGPFTQERLRDGMGRLAAAGWLVEERPQSGRWRLAAVHEAPTLLALLERVPPGRLRQALAQLDDYPQYEVRGVTAARLPTRGAAVALVRLEAYSGASTDQLLALERRLPWGLGGLDALLDEAVSGVLDDALFGRLHPSLQLRELLQALRERLQLWRPHPQLDLSRWVPARLAAPQPGDAEGAGAVLHSLWAQWLLASGQVAALDQLPAVQAATPHGQALADAHADLLQAAAAAWRGDWAEADRRAEPPLAALRTLTGRKKQLLPEELGLVLMLAALAQPDATRWRAALKVALAEGGKREPVLDSGHGFLALALQMRLGDRARDLAPFRPRRLLPGERPSPLDLWRWLARAWLKEGAQPEPLELTELESAGQLQRALGQAGLRGWQAQLAAALQVLDGEAPPPGFFVSAAPPRWQAALSALQAVAQASPAGTGSGGGSAGSKTRLLWLMDTDGQGALLDLLPMEQSQGSRGWGKPKEVPLSRLARGAEALPPHDAAIARCIRQELHGRHFRLDRAAAIAAAVGHPALAWADAPEQLVALAEAGPELEVLSEGPQLRVRMQPGLRNTSAAGATRWASSAAEQKELAALQAVSLWADGPQRARLVRLNEAQQRVAQLLGPEGLEIPRSAADQLQAVLTGLGAHFRVHADESAPTQAAREVQAEPRLRAELSPEGAGLRLRLVAAPFGEAHRAEGPRLVPGVGRARVVATLQGEALSVQRDLAAERGHRQAVLDACPMLPEPPDDAPCEWVLEQPDDALALIERLKPLNALAALDWPDGRAIRVDSAGLAQLVVRVHTKQEWLAVQGELKVSEELVMGLQQLIGLAHGSKSRFVPMGDGRYLALTQELRERLADLAAVAEAARGADLAQLRIPTVAAPWVQAALKGTQLQEDAGFARCLARLDEAQRLVPAIPSGLQASLRPYQEEGVEWALRLAHAGLGAVLADDMGLGKTLQALAVLLARAPQGPALVVAPTSLLGNWRAEARRFAPGLQVALYAEGDAQGDRAALLQQHTGPQQVLLVSYPMLQQEAERFTAIPWATLVLDEAQAIKNAATKRSQAVFGLQAGFRLALSGTPIENRLAELWSIMRACNPGLLGSQARFHERFATLIERQQDKTAQRQLRRLIAPFILRRTKAQVLDDLPPRTELLLQVQAEPAEQAHYEALRRDALVAAEKALEGDAAGQAHLNILAGLTRLRRAACDPRLVTPGFGRPGAKVQAFADLAAELVANGHKALVFSQFVDFLGLLREPLDAAGIRYQYLDGSTPAAERTRRVDAFQQGEGELFLISLKAGGFGLNLTVADYVVIADPWWNPAVEDQASGRAHRIGQQRPVTVYRLVQQGTLEEKILTLHRDKRELADQLLAAGDDVRTLPRADELLALMRDDTATLAHYDTPGPKNMG